MNSSSTIPSVSVVIPTYNRRKSLRAAMESVLRQSYEDFELIISDDASTDDTLAMLEEMTDPRIRVLRAERNRGANAARNAGWRAARGKWIAFHDSDDEWLPLKLEKQMAVLQAPGAKLIGAYCGMITLGADGERTAPFYTPRPTLTGVSGDILPALLADSFVSTQTMVLSADILRRIDGFDESLPALQDWDCVLRAARLGNFALIDEPLVIQVFSPDSITRSQEKRLQARLRIFDKNNKVLKDNPNLMSRHLREIAGAYRRIGNPKESLRSLKDALRLTPRDPQLWALLALSGAKLASSTLSRFAK